MLIFKDVILNNIDYIGFVVKINSYFIHRINLHC